MPDYLERANQFSKVVQTLYGSDMMRHFILYTPGETMVLLYLARQRKKAITPTEISKETLKSPVRISAILRSLEEKGFIERDIDRDDRRKVLVALTEAGHDKATHERKNAFKKLSKIFEEMGKEDSDKLIELSEKFYQAGMRIYNEEMGTDNQGEDGSRADSGSKKGAKD